MAPRQCPSIAPGCTTEQRQRHFRATETSDRVSLPPVRLRDTRRHYGRATWRDRTASATHCRDHDTTDAKGGPFSRAIWRDQTASATNCRDHDTTDARGGRSVVQPGATEPRAQRIAATMTRRTSEEAVQSCNLARPNRERNELPRPKATERTPDVWEVRGDARRVLAERVGRRHPDAETRRPQSPG